VGNGVPNAGQPGFHYDYAGNPVEWRYGYHNGPGVPWTWSDWMPIASYWPVRAAAWTSATAFASAMAACPKPAVWNTYIAGDAQAELVYRGGAAMANPVTVASLNLPP
jgi:hypothetical protein